MTRGACWPRLGLAATVLLASPLLAGPAAEAHAVLVRSSPPHRAVLAQAPERVELWFNERLEPTYSTASGWSEAGSQVEARDVTVTTDDPRRLAVSLTTRAAGRFTGQYQVRSVGGARLRKRHTLTVERKRPR